MATEGFKRKLAAVFSADVAGYSRLMGEDEAATLPTLEAYKQVLFVLIRQHRGRVVASPGTALLAELPASWMRSSAGSRFRRRSRPATMSCPDPENAVPYRDQPGGCDRGGDSIYGDGVNIAARLESLADPGGICVSKTAFEQIEAKLPFGYESLGEQTVKNIAKPVGLTRS